MLTAIKAALFNTVRKIVMAALTEAALKVVVLEGLERFVKSTDNDIDDKYFEAIKKALK